MFSTDSDMGLKLSTMHAVQFAPPLPIKPVLHMQFAIVIEPCTIENVFSGHIKHAAELMFDLNLPAAHCSHEPPYALVKPALQVHAV